MKKEQGILSALSRGKKSNREKEWTCAIVNASKPRSILELQVPSQEENVLPVGKEQRRTGLETCRKKEASCSNSGKYLKFNKPRLLPELKSRSWGLVYYKSKQRLSRTKFWGEEYKNLIFTCVGFSASDVQGLERAVVFTLWIPKNPRDPKTWDAILNQQTPRFRRRKPSCFESRSRNLIAID